MGNDIQQPPYSIVLDTRGNSYVTGAGDTLCQTAKYDADGNQRWKAFTPTGSCRSSAIDANGNIIVTGSLDGDSTQTIKYSPDGIELWSRSTPGLGTYFENKVAVDANGNIFVAGISPREDGSQADYAVIKYDSAGNQLWMRQLVLPTASIRPHLALDAAGNVVVAGTVNVMDESNTQVATDIGVAKIDTNGSLVWQTTWFHTGNLYDSAEDVAVDAAGDVIVAGYVDGYNTNQGAKGVVVKFAGYTGTYQWASTFDGVIQHVTNGGGHNLVTDGEGNSYTAVRVGSDGKIFKFNSAGTQIWSSAAYPGATFNALALDGKGCLVAAGVDSAGRLTVKLCQQGALVCN